jgi:hypothetical protein
LGKAILYGFFPFFMKKKSKTRKDYIKELDTIFSLFIRLRDSDKNGIITCPLCWAKIPRKQAQNMHFIPRGCYLYRRSEENCYWWCMRCNVMLHGNYIVYTRFMQKKFWIEYVDQMINNKLKVYKISTPEIISKIEYYQNKVSELDSLK